MTTATDVSYRVVRLPQPLRKEIQTVRDTNSQTNEQFVAAAVEQHLPRIVDGLRNLGFRKPDGKIVPVRLPFADASGTLAGLKDASESLGIPAVQLLSLCLTAATNESATPSKHRRRTGRSTTKRKSVKSRKRRS